MKHWHGLTVRYFKLQNSLRYDGLNAASVQPGGDRKRMKRERDEELREFKEEVEIYLEMEKKTSGPPVKSKRNP